MADWRNLPNWLGFASWRALSVAAGLSLVPAERALAVDLPPAPILPPISAASEAFTGWLLRGDIGAGFEIRPDIGAAENPIAPGVLLSPHAVSSFGDATLSPSGMIDGGVGYVFTPWLRMDSTLEYRFGGRLQSGYAISDPEPLGLAGPFRSWERLSAGVSSIVVLVNGYVDLGSYWGATPFVGAGIGVADNALSSVYDQGFAVSGGGAPVAVARSFSNASRSGFAWALMAGLDFDIAPNLKLELSYRYLDLGPFAVGRVHCSPAAAGCAGGAVAPRSRGTLVSNDVRIGLVWLVGEPASPGPVVTRY